MKKIFLIILILNVILFGNAFAQEQNQKSNMELIVSNEQQIILFVGFIIAVVAIFLYLARDIIRKKKTDYDKGEFDSKRNKDFEKYHSDWSDDYEDFGARKYSKESKEFRESLQNSSLPNYYKILGIKKDATQDQIKNQYRKLAKQSHPDKTKDENDEKMIQINKAYEVLSNEEIRQEYDKYFDAY